MSVHAYNEPAWRDERHDAELVDRFTRIFHRNPSREDLARFRGADARLQLRMQRRARRRIARLIATF
jgi:hypothetical protein